MRRGLERWLAVYLSVLRVATQQVRNKVGSSNRVYTKHD